MGKLDAGTEQKSQSNLKRRKLCEELVTACHKTTSTQPRGTGPENKSVFTRDDQKVNGSNEPSKGRKYTERVRHGIFGKGIKNRSASKTLV